MMFKLPGTLWCWCISTQKLANVQKLVVFILLYTHAFKLSMQQNPFSHPPCLLGVEKNFFSEKGSFGAVVNLTLGQLLFQVPSI